MDSIIFDVDGTLWDSTGIVAEAWSDYLIHTEHMDTDVSSARLMGLFGQLLPDIARALFPELSEAEQLRICLLYTSMAQMSKKKPEQNL